MHIPVLVTETVEWLAIRPEGVYVDATTGAGGHSQAILEKLTTGRLISIDKDPMALEIARRAYVLDQGKNAYTGTGRELLADPAVIELYLGTLAKATGG